jgi:uncharacterized protein (TIGR02266 family)
MTQDTRKDRRAKIVSLNVRYKSATVDEFIENHSHDVSKGGLFIKTASPFPPGTLLKFEIRIAGDKAVISGVGRVVWKRESVQAGPEAPAGMGVKFIKIDDASRAVIDRLVLSRGEGKNAYDEGGGDGPGSDEPPPPLSPSSSLAPKSVPPKSVHPNPGAASGVTSRLPVASAKDPPRPGGAAPVPTSASGRPQAPFRPTPSAVSKFPVAPPKATMMGLGAAANTAKAATSPGPAAGRPAVVSPPSKAPSPRTPPLPSSTSSQVGQTSGSSVPSTLPMFPKTDSEKEMPPKNEQTVMKQAAELLEEALRGAGGSMDEIGQNPLYDPPPPKDVGTASAAKGPPATPLGLGPANVQAPESPPSSGDLDWEEPASPPVPSSVVAGTALPGAAAAPAAESARPRARDVEATVRSATRDEVISPARPRSAAASLATEEPKKKGSWMVPVLGLAGAGVLGFLFYTQVYATNTDKVDTSVPPPASANASAAATPSASASDPAASSFPSDASSANTTADAASAASIEGADASAFDAASVPEAAAEAAAAAASPPKPATPWRPRPRPATPAAPVATESLTASPAGTDGTPSNSDVPPAAASTSAPAGTATAAAPTATAPATTAPPSPTAKPAKPGTGRTKDDDNPY